MSKEVSNFDKSSATREFNMINAVRPIDCMRDHGRRLRGSNTLRSNVDLMMGNHVRVS